MFIFIKIIEMILKNFKKIADVVICANGPISSFDKYTIRKKLLKIIKIN